jgi:hypothetical protein
MTQVRKVQVTSDILIDILQAKMVPSWELDWDNASQEGPSWEFDWHIISQKGPSWQLAWHASVLTTKFIVKERIDYSIPKSAFPLKYES